jgi:riboflavin kinase
MIAPDDLICLKAIALLGGLSSAVSVSSQSLAQTLSISPQTASRRLISLENTHMISRTMRGDGQYVTVTQAGEENLRAEYAAYRRIFETHDRRYVLEGELISGLGEGRYYVSIEGYSSQFSEKLAITPYPGTFNVKLSPASIETRRKLDAMEWTEIEGFTDHDRTFGGARALKCTINGHICAILIPGRSHYPEDIIELISAERLRDVLGTEDGATVTIEVTR